jgi:DNA-binding beta-propeller fold protein YncE
VFAAAAALVTVILVAQPETRPATQPVTPSQPQTLKVLTSARTGETTPAGLTAGGGWVFAGLWDSGRLLRLDPITLRTTATLQVGSARNGPLSVAYGAGSVWALNFADRRLWRIDPSTMTATLKVTLPAQPSQVAFGDGAVWVTECCTSTNTSDRQRLLRIDPASGAITGSLQVAGDGETVTLAVGRQVSVTSQNAPVLVIDPTTMKVLRTLHVGCDGCEGAAGLSAGDQGLYVRSLSSVLRYDPQTGRLLAKSSEMAPGFALLSAQPDGVWFAADGGLVRLDPVSLVVTARAPVAASGQLLGFGHSIYVSVGGDIDMLGPAN